MKSSIIFYMGGLAVCVYHDSGLNAVFFFAKLPIFVNVEVKLKLHLIFVFISFENKYIVIMFVPQRPHCAPKSRLIGI